MNTAVREQSHSSLETYRRCPRKYRMIYIDDIGRGEPTDPMLRGSAVHRFAADYVKHCRENGLETDLSEVPVIVQKALKGMPDTIRSEVLALAHTFAENHTVPTGGNLYVEEEFGGEFDGIRFRGFLDLVEVGATGRVVVVDYKTDWQLRSQADVDRDPQLDRYALLAWLHFDQPEEITVALDFVRHGVVRESTRTAEQIQSIARSLVADVKQIEEDEEFEARVGAECQWCPHTRRCEAFQAAVVENTAPIMDEETAVLAAQRRAALTVALDAVNAELKPWCSANGNVQIPGLEVGFFSSESYRYPVTELIRVLKDAGMDAVPYLQAATTKVKKLLGGPAGEALKAIRKDASSTRFSQKKVKA